MHVQHNSSLAISLTLATFLTAASVRPRSLQIGQRKKALRAAAAVVAAAGREREASGRRASDRTVMVRR